MCFSKSHFGDTEMFEAHQLVDKPIIISFSILFWL